MKATIDFIKTFLPVLSSSGRMIIVSSRAGRLNHQSERIKNALRDPSITEEKIVSMAEDYIQAIKDNEIGDWHKSCYFTSKALINAWGRFILPYLLVYLENI